MNEKGQRLRAIPAMDIILNSDWLQSWLEKLGRVRVKQIINQELVVPKISENKREFVYRTCINNLILSYCVDLNGLSDYEYIIDFITYLATLQIGKNGASLTREEMLIAVSDFLNLEKDKPKTKELV